MRRSLMLSALAGTLGCFGAAADDVRPKFVEVAGELEFTGQLIVRPRQELAAEDRARALAMLDGLTIKAYGEVDEFIVRASTPEGAAKGTGENELASRLMTTGLFEYAHPNWMCYPLDTPNDPEFPNQWHHQNMQSELAWDISTGSNDVIVAFTDTGIDLTHPDLAPNRVPGFNAPTDTAEVDGGQVNDLNGHGTHVAGCGAAIGNNGIGVSGCGWNMKIMMVRVSDSSGGGAYLDDILQGARWAVEHGAVSASSSYSGVDSSSVGTTGTYIKSIGGLYLYAAGNSNSNWSGFDYPDTIVVGASDQGDNKAGFSSYGVAVDLFAPGVSILSSCNGGGYCYASGTSMATPVANGVVGMIWSANPNLTAAEVEQVLFTTCDDLGDPGNDDYYGWGRVNLFRAVAAASGAGGPLPPIAADDNAGTVATGLPIVLDVLANDFDPNLEPVVIDSFDATTALGGTVTRSVGTGPGGRDELVYTPGLAGNDSFTYTIRDPGLLSDTGTVSATVMDSSLFRDPDIVAFPADGVVTDYYALAQLSALPDFSTLTPISREIRADINMPSTGGVFGGSGLSDDVGAVFTGYINVPATAVYTLYTNSDDGSKLYIGDTLVVNNDGLHGMAEVGGTIGLKAGRHQFRAEFFERGGGAGMIVSIAGGGLGKQVIPASRYDYASPCPADISGSSDPNDPGYGVFDGNVDSADFFYFLDLFVGQNGRADITGSSDPNDPTYGVPDGMIDAADFFFYLDLFVQGCP
ncbi:MAG: S8 family serine peptidase [Phycisphaerales bacterium]|nr:S8 family serine peptidase [Phycisphaerales bacterium]